MTALIDTRENERDRCLVERHQAGDSSAFGELYALHYGRLIRFCRRLVRDSHLAEEIAQDAFLRAYTTLNGLGGERRFYPWLTVIARRLVIDHVRHNGRVMPHSNLDPAQPSSTEDLVVQRMEGSQLLTALDRVRARHREVLRLRDWEGLSYEAIADRLGVAPTAVPPLLHRARAALRREYLLVSEGRVAALLHLPALVAATRRLRDRLAVWGSWLPDASGLTAPMAGMVLSIGTLGASLGAPVASAPAAHHDANMVITSQAELAGLGLEFDPRRHNASPSQDDTAGPSGGTEIVPGVVAGSVTQADGEGTERVRQDGEGRPIFIDTPYVSVWVDPEEDRRKLEGALEPTP